MMGSWASFWGWTLGISLVLFAVISVVVTIGGFRAIRAPELWTQAASGEWETAVAPFDEALAEQLARWACLVPEAPRPAAERTAWSAEAPDTGVISRFSLGWSHTRVLGVTQNLAARPESFL